MKRWLVEIPALLLGLLFLYPLLWMLANSFRPTAEILGKPLNLLSNRYNLAAYRQLATVAGQPLGLYVVNSLVITLGATLLILVITSLGAYAQYRQGRLPGMPLLDTLFLSTLIYPATLLLIPLYFIALQLHLLGSLTGIIIVLAGGAWGGALPYFLFRSFFGKVPLAVIEAAQMDGASEWQILVRVVAPMAAPVYATSGLITAMITWGAWFPVLVISQDNQTYSLATALMTLNGELGINFQTTMALASIVTLPVLLLFLFTQRRVMTGIASGSVKG